MLAIWIVVMVIPVIILGVYFNEFNRYYALMGNPQADDILIDFTPYLQIMHPNIATLHIWQNSPPSLFLGRGYILGLSVVLLIRVLVERTYNGVQQTKQI